MDTNVMPGNQPWTLSLSYATGTNWFTKALMGCLLVAFALPAFGQQPTPLAMQHSSNDSGIQPVQAIRRGEKPLDARIEALPQIENELEVIERRSQLVVTNERIKRIAIADPTVLEVAYYSPTEIAVIGLTRGSTTITIWFDDNTQPIIYLINVIRDPSIEEQKKLDYGRLERKLALLFPNSKVYLIPLSGKIVVKGQAADSAEAARILQIIQGEVLNQEGGLGGNLINAFGAAGAANNANGLGAFENVAGNGLLSSFIVNMLQVPGEFQIQLYVRIAELNRSQLRRLGVDLDVIFADGRQAISSAISGGASTLTGIFENGEVGAFIDALASNGTATILSEPRLTVLSGESASFLAGGEFAVPTVVGVGGAQAATTTFRGFGTSLVVTPSIVDGDLIRLNIIPEFSSVDGGNAVGGVPGLNARRVATTVQLREGQTIVLGGLLSRQRRTEVNRIPVLGDIPVIGPHVFSSKQSTEDETELLIIVTPEIVRPMDPEEVPPVPGFNVTHPTDVEFYHYNMTEGAPDMGVYQLAPYGNGVGRGEDVGYHYFNPAPATPQYAPVPSANTDPQAQPQLQTQPQYQPQQSPSQQSPTYMYPQPAQQQPMRGSVPQTPAIVQPMSYQGQQGAVQPANATRYTNSQTQSRQRYQSPTSSNRQATGDEGHVMPGRTRAKNSPKGLIPKWRQQMSRN